MLCFGALAALLVLLTVQRPVEVVAAAHPKHARQARPYLGQAKWGMQGSAHKVSRLPPRHLQSSTDDDPSPLSLDDILPMPAVGRCPLAITPALLSEQARATLQPALARIQEGFMSTMDLEPSMSDVQNSSTVRDPGLGSIPGASLAITYRGLPILDTHVGAAWTKKAVQFYEQQERAAADGCIPASDAWLSYTDRELQAFHPEDSAGHSPFARPRMQHIATDSTTIYRIGSISKMFTATALFAMVDQGLLGLHDRLVDWMGESWGVLDPWDPISAGRIPSHAGITFAQLAGHTAGLPRLVGTAFNTTADALLWLRSSYLLFPPGSEVSYSNIGYALLGQLLAENVHPQGRNYKGYRPFAASSASLRRRAPPGPRMTFARLIHEYVFAPAGMANSGFVYSPQVMARLSPGYNASGYPVRFWGVGWADPTGGGYSTTADLSRYATALMAAWHGGGTEFVRVQEGQGLAAPIATLVSQVPDAALDPATVTNKEQDSSSNSSGYYLPLSPSAAREMLNGGYWYNRDKVSAWGRPWEIITMPSGTDGDTSEGGSAAVEGGYAPRSKDGGLPSYAAQLTMIPELYVSVAIIWNSQAVPNIPFVAGALAVLVPALETALLGEASLPRGLPVRSPPPVPEEYLGTYIAAAAEPLGSEPVDAVSTTAVVSWSSKGPSGEDAQDAQDAHGVHGSDRPGLLSILLQVNQVDNTTATLGPWELEYLATTAEEGGKTASSRKEGPSLRPAPLRTDVFRIVFNRPGLPITAGGPPRGCITLQGAGVYGAAVYFHRSAASRPEAGHGLSVPSPSSQDEGTGSARGAGGVQGAELVVAMTIPGLQENELYERQWCDSAWC